MDRFGLLTANASAVVVVVVVVMVVVVVAIIRSLTAVALGSQ